MRKIDIYSTKTTIKLARIHIKYNNGIMQILNFNDETPHINIYGNAEKCFNISMAIADGENQVYTEFQNIDDNDYFMLNKIIKQYIKNINISNEPTKENKKEITKHITEIILQEHRGHCREV